MTTRVMTAEEIKDAITKIHESGRHMTSEEFDVINTEIDKLENAIYEKYYSLAKKN